MEGAAFAGRIRTGRRHRDHAPDDQL